MAWEDIYSRTSTYEYSPQTWGEAKKAAKEKIVKNLKNSAVLFTPYSELVDHLRSLIDFGTPRNAVFHCLLGQISDEEEEAGRGLLSALVVHKVDHHPGSGFYGGAQSWGRDISDPERCWLAEVARLQQIWA